MDNQRISRPELMQNVAIFSLELHYHPLDSQNNLIKLG